MITRPTLYINRVTTVDCAILSKWGVQVEGMAFAEALGFSFNVDVELSGRLDPVENVVVDFGALKKFLKSEIDNLEYGYDHKLIVPKSLTLPSNDSPLKVIVESDGISIINGNNQAPNVLLKVPTNAVRITDTELLDDRLCNSTGFIESIMFREFDNKGEYAEHGYYGTDEVLRALEVELTNFLQKRVNDEYPHQFIKIEHVHCDCETIKPQRYKYAKDLEAWQEYPVVSNYFSYTHGLKNSTSMGCRNIVHGHLSYIQLVGEKQYTRTNEEKTLAIEYKAKLQLLSESIASSLNCAHFVHNENVVTSDSGTCDSYFASGRGKFTAQLRSDKRLEYKGKSSSVSLFGKPIVLDAESTIENLVSIIVDKYRDQLKELKVNVIYVSEGLSKGSYYDVKLE